MISSTFFVASGSHIILISQETVEGAKYDSITREKKFVLLNQSY